MTGNKVTSTSHLDLNITPIHSGTLILDSNLSINGSSYTARAFMQILPGAADPSQLLVLGPGAVGGAWLCSLQYSIRGHLNPGATRRQAPTLQPYQLYLK